MKKIEIDDRFNVFEEIPVFAVLPKGGYAIGMGTEIFLLDEDGHNVNTIDLEYHIDTMFFSETNELYATLWVDGKSNTFRKLIHINLEKLKTDALDELPQGSMNIFPFCDGFALIFEDRITYYHNASKTWQVIIDLNKQSILAGQIQFMCGNQDEIKLISIDPTDRGEKVYLITLVKGNIQSTNQAVEIENQEIYSQDGRRIIRIAVPEECQISVEFHAKKFNQTNDLYFAEVERFEGALENHLGKGNRPDVIMLKNHTVIDEYVKKNILADLMPLYAAQSEYSLDDVIPKVREVLGTDKTEGMFAMSGRFQLLLRSSNGLEYDEEGNCNTISYLKWFDRYLTEKEVNGINNPEYFLYAALPHFIDEEAAQAFFTSVEFRQLMETYKEIVNKHKGQMKLGRSLLEKGATVYEIGKGPRWFMDYKCGEGELVLKGAEELYYETSDEQTPAEFSGFENVLNELIFETDKYCAGAYELNPDGTPNWDKLVGIYYTEEQLNQLRYLIDNAIPITRAQEDIYSMFAEEMEAYIQGGKDLDSCCKILQSRAQIYLEERK